MPKSNSKADMILLPKLQKSINVDTDRSSPSESALPVDTVQKPMRHERIWLQICWNWKANDHLFWKGIFLSFFANIWSINSVSIIVHSQKCDTVERCVQKQKPKFSLIEPRLLKHWFRPYASKWPFSVKGALKFAERIFLVRVNTDRLVIQTTASYILIPNVAISLNPQSSSGQWSQTIAFQIIRWALISMVRESNHMPRDKE